MPGFLSFPSPNELDRVLFDAIRGVGDDAELAFAAHARHASGRMARGVKAHTRGQVVEVVVFARNPIGGYDYVGVTRFGHKTEFITPRADRHVAYVIDTKRKRQRGRRATLRFVIGGRVFYRQKVKAFHPDHDWAEDAMPQVRDSADRAMQRIKRKIELS
jgi:hypothetical protein